MSSIASIAARIAGQTPPVEIDSDPSTSQSDRSTRLKLPWRRPRRTKAIASAKLLATQAAIDMLNTSGVAYDQPLPGKLIVEPPVLTAAQRVTFWPARERLRLGNRPTQRGQDIHAFEQALADQGHYIGHHPDRKSDVFLQLQHAHAKRISQWLEQQAYLEEANSAIDECIALSLQRLRDFATNHRMDGQNPQLRAAKRRFRLARRRAMRISGGS